MSTDREILQNGHLYPGFSINWGAIFAGLVLILAAGWLLFALSSAIGMSIVDIDQLQSRDLKGNTQTIGIAAAVWMIITAIITYFLGGYLSGAVSGRLSRPAGTLHGVVLWSCTIVIGMILGVLGVGSIVTTATGAAKSVASSGLNAAAIVASQNAGDGQNKISADSFLYPLTGYLKQGIAKAVAQAEKNTDNKANSRDSNQSSSSNQSASSDIDRSEISSGEIKSASQQVEKIIDRTDPQIFVSAAIALIQGDERQAKEIISSHIDVDEAELDKVIQKVRNRAEVVAEEMKETAEKIKEYATSALWVVLLSYLAGLLACIGGACLSTRQRDDAILGNDDHRAIMQK